MREARLFEPVEMVLEHLHDRVLIHEADDAEVGRHSDLLVAQLRVSGFGASIAKVAGCVAEALRLEFAEAEATPGVNAVQRWLEEPL